MYLSPQMLEKVYVRGSLKNVENGFEFKLKNIVDSGTIGGLKAMSVNGDEVALATVSVRSTRGERKAEEITYQNPLPLNYGSEITVHVAGQTLAAGAEHQVSLTLSVIEAGKVELKFKAEVAEE